MIDVINLQKNVQIDVPVFRTFTRALIATVSESSEKQFAVAFVSDERMIELNQLFRGKDFTTDVLSFPHEPDDFDPDKNNLGDIVISVEQAKKQSEENGLTLETEIKQLMLHGLLHLCGFDHETDNGEMNNRELELRELLDI